MRPGLVRVKKRTGQALPSRSFSFCFSFVSVAGGFISFPYVRRYMGRRSTGIPHYNRASWFGVGKGLFRKARRCLVRGSGTAAAMALRAPCSRLQIQESNKQTKTSANVSNRIKRSVEASRTYTENYINAVDFYGVVDGDGLGSTAP